MSTAPTGPRPILAGSQPTAIWTVSWRQVGLAGLGFLYLVGLGWQGRTAVLTKEGTIQLMSGGTLVMIEGSGSEADRRAFLSAIDLAAIEKAGG